MDSRRTSAAVWGLLLILLGALFLAAQFVGLPAWISPERSWPLIVIGVALLLAIIGVLTRAAGMAVPACVVGGIGCILYYQNLTGDWESWAYIWTLIPGFVGIGIILSGVFSGKLRGPLAGGLWLVFISAVMFAIFGSFLGPWHNLGLARYWPLLLILFGLLLLVQSLARGGRTASLAAADDQERPE